MARIYYSMAGEGRGHATRVRTLVEDLRSEHSVTLLASGDAYKLLARTYRGTDVRIQAIPCLRFQYNDHGLAYWKTLRGSARYLCGLTRLVNRLETMIRRDQPDLCITDFEPALPRAARRCSVPFVSFDHQHFLTTYDLSSLPLKLRLWARALSTIVSLYFSGQSETIVSAFYFPPLRSGCTQTTQVGVLLRPEILQIQRESGDFLLAYFRRDVPAPVLETLNQVGRRTRIYGLGERPRTGNLEFCPISEAGFIRDLASCEALISTAGNQLVGEALFLGKPVFALPEHKNYEQFINAHFLNQSGCGLSTTMQQFDLRTLGAFLEQVPELRTRIQPDRYNGNRAALAAIRRHLVAKSALPVREEVGV